MNGFVQDLETIAAENIAFRRVLFTATHFQLAVIALRPGEGIGTSVHAHDHFFRVEEGVGEAIIDGVRATIRGGFAVVVPAGTSYSILNAGRVALRMYALCAPPDDCARAPRPGPEDFGSEAAEP